MKKSKSKKAARHVRMSTASHLEEYENWKFLFMGERRLKF